MSELTDAPAPVLKERSQDQGAMIWYELMTTDPGGASRFYEAIVPGWRFGEPMPGPVDYRMVGRGDGGNAGGVLKLDQAMLDHGARPMWLGYVCVDDVDAIVGEVEARGGKALMAGSDVPNVGRIALVTDPQGDPFYVMKPIPPAGDPNAKSDVFSPDAEQRVSWNELSTTDPAAARTFYGELFGWGSDEFMDMGEYGEYRFLERGGTRIGALCAVAPGSSGGWRYYIRVPSIAASVEAVKANGGTVSMGPHQVPTGDHIVIGNDPQGAEFALVGKL
jgi:predicted enzyme related to lactoylglutathione lyase